MVSSKLLECWFVCQAIKKTSHTSCFRDVVHLLSLRFCVCSCMFRKYNRLKSPFGCHSAQCAAMQDECLSAVSDERQQSPVSNHCQRSIPCRFVCYSVLLTVRHFLLPIMQYVFLLFLWIFPNFRQFCVWSGSLWDFCSLPLSHLYHSGSLVRGIWNLVVPVHSSERVTPFASVHKSLIICQTHCV